MPLSIISPLKLHKYTHLWSKWYIEEAKISVGDYGYLYDLLVKSNEGENLRFVFIRR